MPENISPFSVRWEGNDEVLYIRPTLKRLATIAHPIKGVTEKARCEYRIVNRERLEEKSYGGLKVMPLQAATPNHPKQGILSQLVTKHGDIIFKASGIVVPEIWTAHWQTGNGLAQCQPCQSGCLLGQGFTDSFDF